MPISSPTRAASNITTIPDVNGGSESSEKIAKQLAGRIAQRAGAGHGEDQNFIAVDVKHGLLLPDAFAVAQVAGMDGFTPVKGRHPA